MPGKQINCQVSLQAGFGGRVIGLFSPGPLAPFWTDRSQVVKVVQKWSRRNHLHLDRVILNQSNKLMQGGQGGQGGSQKQYACVRARMSFLIYFLNLLESTLTTLTRPVLMRVPALTTRLDQP